MAPATVSEAFIAVKNTFLHFDDSLEASPLHCRRASRAKTEPASRFEESQLSAEEDSEDDCEAPPATSRQTTTDVNIEDNPMQALDNDKGAFVLHKPQISYGETHGEPVAPPLQHMQPQRIAGAGVTAQPLCQAPQEEQWPASSLGTVPGWQALAQAPAAELPAATLAGRPKPMAPYPVGPHPQAGSGAKPTISKVGRVQAPGPMPAPPARPQPLELSVHNDAMLVRWTVDAKKLRGSDKGLVSPPFELPFATLTPFKIMLSPTGGMSFGKAGGKGSILLKCGIAMEDAPESTRLLRFSLSNCKAGDAPQQLCSRGPIRHNFAQNGVCGLPKDQQEWDFSKAVNDATQTATVCIEIWPNK